MATIVPQLLKALRILVGVVVVTSASAAPIGEVSQDCFSKATLQRTLDHAHCAALPLSLRDQCVVQTEQNYAAAVATCASKSGGRRIVVPKQSTDAPFTRRLRF